MSLAYVRRGGGPPLVLVHGIGSQWQMWEPVLDRLAREREVIAVDLPGFGDSAPLRGAPSVEALAQSVADLMGELGIERPHAAGNSLGGGVALELGRRGDARSVCVLSPAGFGTMREGSWARMLLLSSRRAARRFDRHAELVVGGPVRRTLAWWHLAGRPWRVPGGEGGRRPAKPAAPRRPRPSHPRVVAPRGAAVADPGGRGGRRPAQPRALARLRDDARRPARAPLRRAHLRGPGDGGVGRARPAADLRAPERAGAAAAARRAPPHARGLRTRADVGRPGPGRPGAARGVSGAGRRRCGPPGSRSLGAGLRTANGGW